jgi:hypothetical protein
VAAGQYVHGIQRCRGFVIMEAGGHPVDLIEPQAGGYCEDEE